MTNLPLNAHSVVISSDQNNDIVLTPRVVDNPKIYKPVAVVKITHNLPGFLIRITKPSSNMTFQGHSAKMKCLERFILLSRSRSRLCQPSKIVFLSSIALLQCEIWRKVFGSISVLIPYHFYSSFLANKGRMFSLLSIGGPWRVLMGSPCIAG